MSFKSRNSASPKYDFQFKLILIGDRDAGKSRLAERFMEGTFSEMSTCASDFWDMNGGERFMGPSSGHYRGAHGIMIVYDITSEVSFQRVNHWLKENETKGNPEVLKLLVGNKSDLSENREVEYETAKEYADEHGMPLIETSAKNATNVEQAFITLVAYMKMQQNKNPQYEEKIHLNLGTTSPAREHCCGYF